MHLKQGILTTIVATLGITLWYLLPPEFQFISIVLILASIILGGWWAIDRFVLTEIDTQKEIQHDNVAVALLFIGYVCVFGVASLCAFAVFFTLK